MKLSIVATLYQSARYISEFYGRVVEVAQSAAGSDYEIIFVNDGSPDDSLGQAIQLAMHDSHVIVVDLSRNFGHHKAMMTGLSQASGEMIFLIDSDLEEDPEWLIPFAQQMASQQCDVVYGVQQSRKGNWFERSSGDLFYRIFNALSGMNLPRQQVTARLMTRRYVDALLLHQEREIFIVGLWHLTGYDQRPHTVKKHGSSQTSYTLRKKFSLMINAVTAFSNAPLIWIFNVGLAISLLSACYVLYIILSWLFFTRPIMGWTSVMASIWLVGGMIICFMGIIGIYLSRMFVEIKQRPYTIIRKIYRDTVNSNEQT